MNVRRFLAPDMRRAIHMVQTEHGPDAVILSSSSVEGGVEIIAAIDYDEKLLSQMVPGFGAQASSRAAAARLEDDADTAADAAADVEAVSEGNAETEGKAHAQTDDLRTSAAPAPAFDPSAGAAAALAAASSAAAPQRESRDAVVEPREGAAPAAATETATATATAATAAPAPTTEPTASSASTAASTPAAAFNADAVESATLATMRKELGLLKGMLREQFSRLSWAEMRTFDPERALLTRRVEALGLSRALTGKLVAAVERPESPDRAWRDVVFGLARRVHVMKEDPLEQGGVMALVGPTGVGKTTTIAKLAARHCLRYGADSLALVTTDHYRVGAQRQLDAYGAILGVPVRRADTAEALAGVLEQSRGKRLVLIDTAGMAPRDSRVGEVLAQLEAAEDIKRYLVLAANLQAGVMSEAVRRFGGRSLAGAVLTKLDEADGLGAALSTVIETKLPVAWLSEGQRVPEDLKLARIIDILSFAATPPAVEDDDGDDGDGDGDGDVPMPASINAHRGAVHAAV